MALGRNTRVHIIKIENGRRWYLHKTDTVRNKRDEILLFTVWHDDPAWSRPCAYEIANMIRDRLKREQRLSTHLALQAGDAAELIQD
jgi:hypothetical protein